MNNYSIVDPAENKELLQKAAEWFHSKWGHPTEAYANSMVKSLTNAYPVPKWFVVMDGEGIIGGAGVIENDFHNRPELTPNVCAVYVEKEYRNRGVAGKLLNHICARMKDRGISTLYLLTDHTGFYERYGWELHSMVQGDGEAYLSRMYVHKM